ncbi:hypothetical protein EOS_01960 [Caballeronia mineralivorans PML1(12)]|uniref:Uncharacterized protein n=1 Tax=Caballeronia mineralivorans PML1(12) TaxID=908627 RepID=A0A0J1D5B1_9BURK|nr:hypothetical protein [Caballeronia mineralivorans]KLU27892.1 hypothetical protein EOS_01960 [Caballeronia mineralivorans PML1(12)]
MSRAGRSVGVRMHVLARDIRDEALAELEAMMANSDEVARYLLEYKHADVKRAHPVRLADPRRDTALLRATPLRG